MQGLPYNPGSLGRDEPRLKVIPGYPQGGYVTPVPYAGSSNGVLVLSRLFVFPFYVGKPTDFDSIGVACIGVASSFVRFVIYSDGGGYPNRLLFDSGQVDSSGGAFLTYSLGNFRSEGMCWPGVVGQGVAPSVKRMNVLVAHPIIVNPNPNSAGEGPFYYQDSISGAPPVKWGSSFLTHGSGAQVPVLYIRPRARGSEETG